MISAVSVAFLNTDLVSTMRYERIPTNASSLLILSHLTESTEYACTQA